MFILNKYWKCYFAIIEHRKAKGVPQFFEKHHIIPRSLGGSNDTNNIIALTPREHFICHLLLARFTEGVAKSKMTYAIQQMSLTPNNQSRLNFIRNYKVNSYVYSFLKENRKGRGPMSEEQKIKISKTLSGRKHTDKTKQKISNNHRRNQSKETSNKISLSKSGIATRGTGWTHSEETKEKMSLSQKGREFSEDHKKKLSEAAKNRSKRKTC